MRSVKTSELKAKLAKYLKMARQGETIEVLDRGQPIAVIRGVENKDSLATIPPLCDPAGLAKLKSKIDRTPKTDIVSLLLDDRHK